MSLCGTVAYYLYLAATKCTALSKYEGVEIGNFLATQENCE